MTSIKGDPRGILGIPEEGWFETLAKSSDWRALGVADRPDLDETQRVFAAVWALSEPSQILSYPNEFVVNQGTPQAAAAPAALRAIGANEAAAYAEAGPEPLPQRPEWTDGGDEETKQKFREQELRYYQAVRNFKRPDHFNRDIRSRLIRYLDARGVFPLDNERERLEEVWGGGGERRRLDDLKKLEAIEQAMRSKP